MVPRIQQLVSAVKTRPSNTAAEKNEPLNDESYTHKEMLDRVC
jgi:hypothetical protein